MKVAHRPSRKDGGGRPLPRMSVGPFPIAPLIAIIVEGYPPSAGLEVVVSQNLIYRLAVNFELLVLVEART